MRPIFVSLVLYSTLFAQEAGSEIFKTGSGVTPPMVISRTRPVSVPNSLQAGTVRIGAVVDTKGSVTTANVEQSWDAIHDKAALDAVKQWRFRPATQYGRPVSARVLVDVNFWGDATGERSAPQELDYCGAIVSQAKGLKLSQKDQRSGWGQFVQACRALSTAPIGKRHSSAIPYLEQASALGVVQAELLLTQFYSEGTGIPVNRAESLKWIRVAQAHGVAIPPVTVDGLLAKMTDQEIQDGETSAVNWLIAHSRKHTK